MTHAIKADKAGGTGCLRALKRPRVAERVGSETRLREAFSEVSEPTLVTDGQMNISEVAGQ